MKWTLSGVCYYLIWFFAVGTTACGTSTPQRSHRLGRAEFEQLVRSDTTTHKYFRVSEKKHLKVDKSSRLFVYQKEQKRSVVPFAFTIDEDLVTPIPDKHAKAHRSPFTLTPTDNLCSISNNKR